jgi:hypothetical protein
MSVRDAGPRSFSLGRASGGSRSRFPEARAVTPFGAFAMVASLLFLAAGIVWPQAAGALLRLLLATLALGYVVGRLYQTVGPVAASRQVGSPFEREAGTGAPSPVPEGLRKFTAQVRSAGDARLAERKPIPREVREVVTAEVARRLAERHGLHLGYADDQPAIRSLLSEPTWALVRPDRAGVGEVQGLRRPVPLSRLGSILDDLERL